MKFGLFGGALVKRGADTGDSQGYRDFIDYTVEAEALGFHSTFIVEHHFTGVGQISASLNILTYLAGLTKTIRLGTAVIVVPWHNPVLLAEQAATLDLLSNGRLELGVGKGYRHSEFHGFGIALDEAQERFDEAMTIMRKAWASNERFSHRGKRWIFDDIVVEPAPVQSPHPPLWLAAGRPDSIRGAVAEGYNLLLDQMATFDVIGERLDVYRQAVADCGRTYDPMRVGVARAVAVVDTPEQREAAIAQRRAQLDNINSHGRTPDGKFVSSMVSEADTLLAVEKGALLGSPDEIIGKLKILQGLGVEYVLLFNINGSRETLRRFARDVMPAFA